MEVELNNLRFSLWPLGTALLGLLLVALWRRKRSASYLLCCLIFGSYLLLAVDKLFFPIRLIEAYAGARLSINLIPFNFDFSFIAEIVLQQILQNILLTVPFGFGINFVAQVRARRVPGLALAVGGGIEAGQLVISLLLGYPYRIIDVNDVLLNGLGVLIGYGLFRLFAWGYVWGMERIGLKRWGLVGYVYEIARRA